MLTCGKPGTKAAENSPDHSIDNEKDVGEDDAAVDCTCARRSSGCVVVVLARNVGDQEDSRVVDDSSDKNYREA